MVDIIFGHLVGDYLLQNNWMALNKAKYDLKGWVACFGHCFVYTLTMAVFTNDWSAGWIVLVFLSHFLIDKFGFVEWYLHTIKGRSIKDCLRLASDQYSTCSIDVLQISITAFVYIVCDNTFHLLVMVYGRKLLVEG